MHFMFARFRESIAGFALLLTMSLTLTGHAFGQGCPAELYRTFGTPGTDPSSFDIPADAVQDGWGNIFVTDFNNNRIQRFSREGIFQLAWGSKGTDPGQFDGPNLMAIDQFGNLYVTDYNNCRIQKFTRDGQFLLSIGSPGSDPGQMFGPTGIALDSDGNIYVCDSGNYRIEKFSSSGTFLASWGQQGSGNGQFTYAADLKINSKGVIYVVDGMDFDGNSNGRVQAFDLNGNFLFSFGGPGTDEGQFIGGLGIGIDSRDRVYVTDFLLNRIQIFGPQGNFIAARGKTGTNPGQYNGPDSVSFGLNGEAIICEAFNNRVQIIRGFLSDCQADCVSGVCYNAPGNWAFALQNNPGFFGSYNVVIPGDNFGYPQPLVTAGQLGGTGSILALQTLSDGFGRKTPAEQLSALYLAAQISIQHDLPFGYGRLNGLRLGCQLVPPDDKLLPREFRTLTTGVTLTESSNMQDLFDATNAALKSNDPTDIAELLRIYRLLRACGI